MKLIKVTVSLFLTLSFLISSPLPAHAATSCTTDDECNINNSIPGPQHLDGCYILNPPFNTTSNPQPEYLCSNTVTPTYSTFTPTPTTSKTPSTSQNSPAGGCQSDEINTALGCISTDVESGGFINTLLQLAIGLGGMIALLLILGGVFIITTSAGIPDKLNQGKELITSAISGLLFIILSVVLLNLIGIKILAIPGF